MSNFGNIASFYPYFLRFQGILSILELMNHVTKNKEIIEIMLEYAAPYSPCCGISIKLKMILSAATPIDVKAMIPVRSR
jgi:hypothetical protein